MTEFINEKILTWLWGLFGGGPFAADHWLGQTIVALIAVKFAGVQNSHLWSEIGQSVAHP